MKKNEILNLEELWISYVFLLCQRLSDTHWFFAFVSTSGTKYGQDE